MISQWDPSAELVGYEELSQFYWDLFKNMQDIAQIYVEIPVSTGINQFNVGFCQNVHISRYFVEFPNSTQISYLKVFVEN